MESHTLEAQPTRAEVDGMAGPVVLEFGTPWCGYCRGAEPLIRGAMASHPQVRHVKVEDGPGQPLGRSFGVRLWPTLVFLKDGKELGRVTRPSSMEAVRDTLERIDPTRA